MKRVFKNLICALVLVFTLTMFVACDSDSKAICLEKLDSDMITLNYKEFVYNGSAQEPTVSVKGVDGNIDAEEYTVEYKNNINAGTAKVIVSSNPESKVLRGSVEIEFIINRAEKTIANTSQNPTQELILVLQSNNYSVINVYADIELSTTNLEIDKAEKVYFNGALVNDKKIINKGEVHIKDATLYSGFGSISNEGATYTNVDGRDELIKAFEYATYIKLNSTIVAPATPNEDLDKIALIADDRDYRFVIDLNGYSINVPLAFSNVYRETENQSFVLHTYDYGIDATLINSNDTKNSTIGTTEYSYGVFLHGSSLMSLSLENLQVYGNTYALVTNGCSYNFNATLTATNCVFTSPDTYTPGMGAYLPAAYKYTFKQCTFEGATGYYTKNGIHNIVDCVIKGTGNKEERDPQGEGGAPTGAAIDIDWGAWTTFPFDMSIYNTVLESKNNVSIQEYPNWVGTEGDDLGMRDVTRHVEIKIYNCDLNSYASPDIIDEELKNTKFYSANDFIKIIND